MSNKDNELHITHIDEKIDVTSNADLERGDIYILNDRCVVCGKKGENMDGSTWCNDCSHCPECGSDFMVHGGNANYMRCLKCLHGYDIVKEQDDED